MVSSRAPEGFAAKPFLKLQAKKWPAGEAGQRGCLSIRVLLYAYILICQQQFESVDGSVRPMV